MKICGIPKIRNLCSVTFRHADGFGFLTFLYRLLELIRTMGDSINLARFAYVLARLEPDEGNEEEQKAAYSRFSKQMYSWVQNGKDRRELVTAIYLYLYLHRGGAAE